MESMKWLPLQQIMALIGARCGQTYGLSGQLATHFVQCWYGDKKDVAHSVTGTGSLPIVPACPCLIHTVLVPLLLG